MVRKQKQQRDGIWMIPKCCQQWQISRERLWPALNDYPFMGVGRKRLALEVCDPKHVMVWVKI